MHSPQRKTKTKSCTPTLSCTMFAFVALFVGMGSPAQAQVPTPTTLYGFQQAVTDAASPYGVLAQGRDGNLYGTGVARAANFAGGVFRVTLSGKETLLVSFPANWTNCEGLTLGLDGNFYGTCTQSGTSSKGLIYKVTPSRSSDRLT